MRADLSSLTRLYKYLNVRCPIYRQFSHFPVFWGKTVVVLTVRAIFYFFVGRGGACCEYRIPKKRVEASDTSRGKVREILGLSTPMNKMDRPTYLGNVKEYLIVTAD